MKEPRTIKELLRDPQFRPDAGTVGRFAPSPSGRMHLGNVYAAVMSWLLAKAGGGKWILRIEDLDEGRCRPEYARLIEDDLHWLGLDWDEGGTEERGPSAPYTQSRRYDRYEKALSSLREKDLLYPCYCTRADIMAGSAPHADDGTVVYSGLCRLPGAAERHPGRKPATRLIVPDETIEFTDGLYGAQHVNLAKECGDFIVRRADGSWAYQLAVSVDDAEMGVNQVVRGCDLLSSAARQIYIHRLLGFTPPSYIHLPLLRNEAGQRLSKRDASLSMEEMRKRKTPEEIIGEIAFLAGITPADAPLSSASLMQIANL